MMHIGSNLIILLCIRMNPMVKILNRQRVPGRLPAGIDIQDIPAQYRVLPKNGEVVWLPLSSSLFEDQKVRSLVTSFEIRYPRDSGRPCEGVGNIQKMKQILEMSIRWLHMKSS
jgi:hypothetical protein